MRRSVSGIRIIMALSIVAVGCGGSVDIPTAEPGADGLPVDLARIEYTLPLSREVLDTITPDNIDTLTQEQVDQLYARLSAGPIPDGPYDGGFFLPRGEDSTRFGEIIGGGVAGGLKRRVGDASVFTLEWAGTRIWGGKYFFRDQMLLRNRIARLLSFQLLLDEAQEAELESHIDPELGEYLLFPAQLYCGQSLIDARRESIIIDYAYTDTIEGYFAPIDHLGGRDGFKIRDEIRMVRPGFYLGRAYMNRVFGLNFWVYNEEVAAAGGPEWLSGAVVGEDCFVGEQQRAAG